MEDNGEACDNSSIDINSGNESENDVANLDGNPKLADALSRILRAAKKKPTNKSVVLSKAKLHGVNKQVKKETCGFEIEPDPNAVATVVKEEEENIKPKVKEEKIKSGLSRREKLKRGRVIPSVLDREKERQLTRVAVQGVVQLFNAVKKQQSSIEKQFKEKKLTEVKREKILKSIDRKGFLNALSSCGNISLKHDITCNDPKAEVKGEESCDKEDSNEKQSWEVLRGDFMMDAKLKDWDRKAEDELSS